ncbi:MAG: acetyl-CoA C-acyltransferase [Gemmatimonadales bacterium]|uniref:acetyl-CoA C-acyltransferase n=1 Tax=Candidatus Palauibacter irciniicola TaxID=3056733 RepID=UPI0013801529|nr:acetyl-CoA C-acyltransferase [Candidatus Palauibacter irciniicola]MYC17648.1 acetyl-CoA C-acyltransferase [Gemmatimonadales bacterium]
MSDSERTPVIVSAARLPTGRFMGGLSSLAAPDLGGLAISAAVDRAGVAPEEIDDVIMGNVVQAGVGQAPARQAAIRGGVPVTVPAVTVNKVCGSGLKAVMLAAQAIKAGDARVVVAGGMESMSNAPYLLRGHREGVKFGDRSLVDGLIHDGLWCAFGTCHMGGHAEYTAHKAGVSREDQDAYALGSHEKAIRAIDAGEFAEEVVPVHIETRKGTVTIDTDETPRRGTSLEALARLRPAFAGDAPPEVTEPSVTAGNAPGLNDGGAATVVASEAYATAHGLPVLGRIRAYSVGATAPRDLFFAPVAAVQKLMTLDGTVVADYGLVEMNEAFAVQCLADARELGLDLDRVNVRGGAIALGHPIGASGAKILTTLLHAMRDRDVERGMATLCLGGGNAVALSVERR